MHTSITNRTKLQILKMSMIANEMRIVYKSNINMLIKTTEINANSLHIFEKQARLSSASALPALKPTENQTSSSSELMLQKKLVDDMSISPTFKTIKGRPRIVILGSGWGSYNFLQHINKERYDVRVISPTNHFLFTPLLPSSAVGTLEFRAIQEPIRCTKHLSGYYQGKAKKVDFKNQEVVCNDIFSDEEFIVPYDYLVIATGCKTNTFNTPGVAEREGKDVFFLKHLYHARQIRNRILECFELASINIKDPKVRDRLLSFVVVGGGPTSVEFVGELHDFLTEDAARFFPELRPYISVHIVEASGHLLGAFDQTLVSHVEKNFRSRNIDVRLNTSVTKIDNETNSVVLSDGSKIPFGMLVWSAGLRPIKFIDGLDNLNKTKAGRILITERLLVDKFSDTGRKVFALGDCAVNNDVPLAQLAQVARKQGIYLAKAFNSAPTPKQAGEASPELGGLVIPKKPFSFYNLGMMATLGGWNGVVDFSHVGTNKTQLSLGKFSGMLAFVTWRTAYLGRQVSIGNMILIPVYWLKAWLLGRDISRF